jgi:hypothetical protein
MKKFNSIGFIISIFSLIILLGSIDTAFGVGVTLFGPKTYLRDTGKPGIVTDTFTVSPRDSNFHLLVQNGADKKTRVSSATIRVNGVQVLGPSDFNKQVDLLDKPISLLSSNNVQVELRSEPGSFIVVRVVGDRQNTFPVANAGPDQTVTEGNIVVLNGSGSSDADGDPLTYEWSFISRPTGSNSLLSNANTLSPSFVADVAGTYVVQLIVNDGKVNSVPDEVEVTVTTRGVLLPGAPTSLALNALSYFDLNNGVMESQIGLDKNGRRVARVELEVEFADSATVGEVNGLLNSIGGRIVNMLEGIPILLIRIPDPGSISGLEQVISQVEANPIVVSVRRAYFPALRGLPDNHTSLSYLDKIDHHLAVRAHGAWNVKDALPDDPGQAPLLLVADGFGGGPPVADFSVWANIDDFGVFPQYNPHGYHVLGIISAEFGGNTSDRGLATGIYPKTLELRAVDLTKNVTDWKNVFLSFPAIEDRILEIIAQSQRPVVLNTSFGFPCDTPSDAAAFCTDGFARSEALRWIRKVRIGNLEGKFIHIAAAGNTIVPSDTDARYDSQFAASALIGDLQTPGGTPVPPLDNVLVVENVIASGSPPQPICLNGDVANGMASKYHGEISAVGTDVWSLLGGEPNSGAGNKTGTSQAAPQVAGVVAQMWAMDIQKSNLTVINRLLGTTSVVNPGTDPRCSAVPPARVVDAYTALLSMDDASGLSMGDLSKVKVRRTLLDVADGAGNPGSNGLFDEKDLELLINKLEAQPVGLLDYSRYDLNGDGYTGGNKTGHFDLDINDPPAFTTVTQDINGNTFSFNENSLTDMQILCYYAYSDLYSGDATTRKDLLRDRCAQLTAELTFPSSISSGGSTDLQVRAGYLLPDGSTQWSEGINVSVSVSGGSAATSSGTTDADGYFSTTINHDGTSEIIRVTATVTDSGEREITKTAEATIGWNEVPWELTFLRSVAVVSGDPCDYCREEQRIGDTEYTSPPLPLPATIATTCPPYSGATATVQAGAGHLTIDLSGSGTRAISECNPYRVVETAATSSGSGRMSTPGTYTATISASPSFNPQGVLAESEQLLIQFTIYSAGGGSRNILCSWGKSNFADSQCCDDGPQGKTCVPVGPYSVDIEVPQGINTWSYNFQISAGRWNYIGGNPGDISVSDAVISIIPKP